MKRCMMGGWLATAALTGLLFGIGGCGGGGHGSPVEKPLALSDMPVEPVTTAVNETVSSNDSKAVVKTTYGNVGPGVASDSLGAANPK